MRHPLACLIVVLLGLLATSACRSQEEPRVPPRPTTQVNWNVVLENLRDDYTLADAKYATAPPAVRDSNLPLAALELEKMLVRLQVRVRDAWWTAQQEASQRIVEEALQRLAAGRPAHEGVTGAEEPAGYFTRAYLCRTDDSPQPYHVRLPTGYDPTQRYPLVVFLHGYVPETSKVDPWVVPANQWQLAADRGLILVLPHGRRNSDFLGIGEVDVLRVIEEMQRWYPVDPDRVVLTGCSMGGYGGWAIGLRHPDRFAGLGLMSGQTDFFTWERRDREQTRYKSWCVLQNNPLDLAPNARQLPMYLQHGADDNLVPVAHSRLIAPVMKDLGYQLEYQELAGQGHYIYWEDPPFERLFDWAAKQRRDPAPREVRFRTFTPRQGRAYWVDVRRLLKWGPAAEVTAAVTADGVTVTTTNIAELWLDLPRSLCADRLPVRINGHDAGTLQAGPHQVTINAVGEPTPAKAGDPPAARPRVGPAREVFNEPFLVVWASGGSEERTAHNQQQATRFRNLWYGFAEGLVSVVADTALTAEQVRSHNLVIFGEPGDARLAGIAQPAATLPAGVTLQRRRYTVGEHVYEGDQVGMVLLVPHPLDEQRLLLWWSGHPYGQGLPVNHQFDLLPDLLVYNDQVDWDGTNKYLIGGFLSPDWQLDPAALDVAPPNP